MDLETRLSDLHNDLMAAPPADPTSPVVGDVFNALLAEAKEQYESDPVVAAIKPLESLGMAGMVMNATNSSVRAAVGQLLAAARGS